MRSTAQVLFAVGGLLPTCIKVDEALQNGRARIESLTNAETSDGYIHRYIDTCREREGEGAREEGGGGGGVCGIEWDSQWAGGRGRFIVKKTTT